MHFHPSQSLVDGELFAESALLRRRFLLLTSAPTFSLATIVLSYTYDAGDMLPRTETFFTGEPEMLLKLLR